MKKAQFGGIEATLQQSKSLFDKARSKHFHAHGEGWSCLRFRSNGKYMLNPIFDYVSSSSSEDEEEPEPVPEPVIEPEPEPVPEPVPDVNKGAVF